MKRSILSLLIFPIFLIVASGCGGGGDGSGGNCDKSGSFWFFGEVKWCANYGDDNKSSLLGDISNLSLTYDEYLLKSRVFVMTDSGAPISNAYSVSYWALDTENCGSYFGSVTGDYPANDGYPLDILILQVPAGCGETIEGTSTVFVSAPDYSPIYTNFSFTLTRSVRDENKLTASMSDLYFTLEPEVSNELETKSSEL